MEPTMDPNDSPLSNLDVWCDWSGVPEEPVSITIAMELQTCGHPNLNLPILSIQSPNTVKIPSWVIRLKPDYAHYGADTPPEKEDCRHGLEHSDETEKYPAKNGSVPDSGSVVVHDDPQGVSRQTVDISGMYTKVDGSGSSTSSDPRKSQVDSLGSQHSSNPRKRSAKAASLPDSIAPDDEYQCTRHKLMMTKSDLPLELEPVSEDNSPIIEKISSFISSLEYINVTPENILLPQDSVPVSPNITSEHPLLNGKGATIHNVPESDETSLSKIDLSGTEPLTEANLLHWNYDTLSTRGCNGSLSDTEDSDKEKEDLLLSLESIASPSFFSCSGFNGLPLSPTSAEIDKEHNKPKLILDNCILYVQTPSNVYSATYQIAIALKVRLQRGKSREWWELVVNGLPRLAQFESGYLYFRTPPGQGMEFMTSSFKRHTLVESCLMAQFHGGKCLVVPFRKCNAENYGQLKDHKVNTVIRAEVVDASDPSSYLIKYNAVCSIDLINHNFWTEKCKFDLFVHGGPDGEFNAVFAAKKPLINSVRLQTALDGMGISHINVISVPQALEMFTVSWEITLPRGKAVTWLPWIKTTLSCRDVETTLQEDYAIFSPNHEVISPKRQKVDVDTGSQFSRSHLGVLFDFKPPVMVTPAPYLQRGALLSHKPKIDGSLFGKPASKSTSTQTVAGTPVAEPKKPGRAVGLWTLIKFVFQLLSFLASVHTIYWSYLLLKRGFRLDSRVLPTSCPENEVYVYNPLDYAENVINADLEKELETVLMEFNIQPEPIRFEVQPSVNTTPAEVTPMPLRDRIDYLLGWRGPIARE
ncbi:hypothetical protein N7536_003125 [Penicillium majusculum]|uniref:Uncharacterized protein n=1 Tax=Penicillium solitum TaxID=60172 RepID=A0A1V6RCX4_9EURO|nr:uncharacterized protein PENSOL_c007G08640 [Penicillium solitum]KAJ5700112.1 hypothetical protein N7536_003125 [Penicillium majusculum]OQD99269.1 hypothetical protein PENSOL_c007G08640 [Penicillium solitum]